MKTDSNQNRRNRGFSLVEMLVVIAVIGILAGIAIGAMSSTNETAKTNAAKRNAQTLCSLYSSARSVGASFTSATKAGILDEMIIGRSGTDLSGSQFKMSPLAEADKTAALAYCTFDSATESLNYHDDGVLEEAPVIEDTGWSEWMTFWTVPQSDAAGWVTYFNARYPDGRQHQSIPRAGDPTRADLQWRYRL
jgi:prepilin-type N-terminal cleavage/methylation domain-containing protein